MKRNLFILFFLSFYFSLLNAQNESGSETNVKVASTVSGVNKVEIQDWVPSVRIYASPATENTQSLASLELLNKGLGGLEHKWVMQMASNTNSWGVLPNGCEIWEYPSGESARRRFAFQTGRGQSSYSCVTIGPRGGVSIGYDPYFVSTDINDLSVNGNVGIGTTDTKGFKLAVKGKICAGEIVVSPEWADFVFKKDYKLPTLNEVKKHIDEKGTLPGVPSEADVKANGVGLGEVNALLLQKIEELTLYVIKQQEEINELKESIKNNM